MIHRFENIDNVIEAARALPEFPAKSHIVRCLEARNVNDYGRALELINEFEDDPAASPPPPADLRRQLDQLADRIRLLEASDVVSE